jgi:hypothetical protein
MKPTGDVAQESNRAEPARRRLLLIAASLVMAFAVVVVISLAAEADYEAAGLESGSRE